MDRRLMMFTIEALNQHLKIKLKNSNKIYSGTLQAFDPFTFSIVVQNFIGADDRAEFKVISLQEIEYFTVESNKVCKEEGGAGLG
jgi:small nuclear ribonucleoprotein (snRNP)-like protein